LLQRAQAVVQPVHRQFLAQQLVLGLLQQAVARVVLAEDLVVQRGRSLQLPLAARLARVALEDQAADAGDLAKAPARQLAGVQAGAHLLAQRGRLGRGQGARQHGGPVHGRGAQQLQAVVVDGHREGGRGLARQAPGQQRGQAQVHRAAGKG
jgi:hypothetical protein